MATQNNQKTTHCYFSSSSTFFSSPRQQQHRHPASLLPSSCHNPRLLSIIAQPVSKEMVKWIAQTLVASIDVDEGIPKLMLPTPPATPNKPTVTHISAGIVGLPPLEEFITRLVQKSGAHVATLLSTLIYLERLCAVLSKQKGIPCSRHRVFLATLIVAAKYLNDSGPKNCNWTEYAQWFSNSEVNLMELQLLSLLNYRLRFTEEEACKHFAPFLSNVPPVVQYGIRQSVSSTFDSSVQTARQGMKRDVLTPSCSANEIPNLRRTFPREYTPQKRISQRFLMPLLTAARNNRFHHQQQNLSLPTPEAMSPLALISSGSDRSLKLPSSQTSMRRSSSFLNLDMVNGMDLLTLSSPPSSSSQSDSTGSSAPPTTSRAHVSNLPGLEIPRQPSMAHLSDSLPPLPPYSAKPSSSSECNDSRPGGSGTTKPSPSTVKNQLDGFLRKMLGRHGADPSITTSRPQGLQDYGVFHAEKPYHVSVPLFKDFLRPVAADQVLEPMVVC